MTKTEKIKLALHHCIPTGDGANCIGCPYRSHTKCVSDFLTDIQALIAANEQTIEAAKNLLELRTRERDQVYLDIAALEAQLGELLSYATDGRYSKPTYSLSDMKRCIDESREIECEKCEELAQVKRERDAAVKDIAYSADCWTCGHFELQGDNCQKCRNHTAHPYWEWRGAKETADD